MLASVTMCNDDIRNYNSKISDLGPLTPSSKGWCLCRARDGVYVWLGVSYTRLTHSYLLSDDDIHGCGT